MHHGRGIRYALLGAVSRNPDGVHGYALKRQCERILGNFWQLNFGEVYRTIDRLAVDGLIEHVLEEPESTRKLYRITEKGRGPSIPSSSRHRPTRLVPFARSWRSSFSLPVATNCRRCSSSSSTSGRHICGS